MAEQDDLDIYTKDWAQSIVKDLAALSSKETQTEVIDSLKNIAFRLDNFIKDFRQLRDKIQLLNKKVEKENNFSNIIRSNQNMTMSLFNEQALAEQNNYSDAQRLYEQTLRYTVIGYYLLNTIRDTFFEPIEYAIGFMDDGEISYIEPPVTLEELLSGTVGLSNRVDVTENNFARLEINIKDLIKKLRDDNRVKSLKNDALFDAISNYTSAKSHTYMTGSGRHKDSFKMGYTWETYRHMKLYGLQVSDTGRNVQYYYEKARKGNLAYYKGGDVLAEQDKFGTTFALTSTAAILNQLNRFNQIFMKNNLNIKDVQTSLENIFLQKEQNIQVTDKHLRSQIQKDKEKLIAILKIK